MSTRANVIITAQNRTQQAFASVSRSLNRMQQSVSRLLAPLGQFKALLGGIGLAILVKESIRAAEALRGMDARVRRATESLGDFNRVQRELYEIAQRNGTALIETSNLFIALNRAAEDLGRGRGEVLKLTDTIQQLGVISGASGEAMKNSLRQFSQAMAGGVVRAEEFNSIIENTPEIAVRIAKGMGLTVGQLRLAVVEGKVLSEDVFDSLLGQGEEIRREFEKMPLTIGRAWQSLKNAMSRFIADANEAGGTTQGIAENIKGIADAVDNLNQRVASGELSAELALWMETFTDMRSLTEEFFGWMDMKISGGIFDWSEFFKDLPAVAHIAFVEVFAVVDRAISTINTMWRKLPFLWDKLWLNIKTKAKEWWAQIVHIFDSDEALGDALAQIEREYGKAVQPINESLSAIDESYQSALRSSREAVAAIREEQFARMANRREMEETAQQAYENIVAWEIYDGALNDLITAQKNTKTTITDTTAAIKEQSIWSKSMSGAIGDFTKAWDSFYKNLEGRYKSSLSDVLDLWDKLGKAIPGVGDSAKEAIDKGTTALFDMKEAILDVQRSLQQGFSDLFYDIFSGKGISSVKDFAKRVLDIFKRLFADIAAAWVASKIFGGTINIGGIGGLISGGGIGGAIGQGTGIGGSVASSGIGKAIGTGLTKIGTAIKGIFTGGSSAGAFGAGAGVNPATMTGGLGKGFAAGLGGLAIPAAIFGGALLGTQALAASDAKEVAKYTSRYQQNFGGMAPEGLGQGGSFLGAFENGAGTVDEMYVAVSEQLNKALEQTGLIVRSLNLQFEESGDPVRRLIGDVDAVKTALSGAKVRGFEFAGSLETAIEKGSGLRVSIEGDADVIKQKLAEATAAGVGGFRDLKETGQGVSALLTGDIAQWNRILQEFVNGAVMAAVGGVNALGGAAASATGRFAELASAASRVSVGGGRAAQVDPYRNLPKFEYGGITSGPSIAGEAGPELIVPIKNGKVQAKLAGGGDSGQVVTAIEKQTREIRRQARARDYRLG